MAEGAAFMIHNAKTLAYGDKSDLRHTADVVEKIEGAIVNDYTTRTGKDEAEIRAAMQAETWFTAAEALEYGFVDRVTGKTKVKNTWNLAAFKNAPVPEPEPPPEPKNESTEPAPEAGFFMSASNANRLRLAQIA
jgi:ATP-dependent Clp protease protease subunit